MKLSIGSQTKGSQKKRIWLWALYDFANSLAFANVSFYFALWLVGDKHVSPVWVSIPAALSTLVLLATLPFLGSLSDRLGRRMPFLTIFSILAILCLLILGLLSARATGLLTIAIIVVLYFFFLYCYQAALAFYDAMLQSLSSEKSKEQISGFGMAAGQMGNMLGIMVALPFVSGGITVRGISGRPVSFILGALLFLLFSIPTFLFLKDNAPKISAHGHPRGAPLNFFAHTWQTLKNIKSNRPAFNYLIIYYLFSDALLTLQLFMTLYLEVVGGLNDKLKTIVGAVGLLAAVLGSLASGSMGAFWGSTRKAILFFIGTWAMFLGILALATSAKTFVVIGALNGFSFGALYSLSRAYYSSLAPKEKQAEFFGVYTLFERFASVLGPLVWSVVLLTFAPFGEIQKYRFAMLSLAVLVAISFLMFLFSKNSKQPAG